MFVLNNTKELKPGKTWIDDNGVQHPGNWASVWSDDVKASYGIKEVVIQAKPDSMFYWVSGPALDGTWSSRPKNIDDVKEVDKDGKALLDEDGNQLVTKGLKSQWIAIIKKTANGILAPTDWQVIAKAERDRAIDSDVATYRAAVITACTAIEKAITDITDTAIPSGYDNDKENPETTYTENTNSSDDVTEVDSKCVAFKVLFDTPVDRYGKPTGNEPMFDWPEQ